MIGVTENERSPQVIAAVEVNLHPVAMQLQSGQTVTPCLKKRPT